MAAILDNAKIVYAAGTSSAPTEPNKSDIIRLFALIEGILGSAVNGLIVGSAVVYQARASLFANLARPDGSIGVVYGDSNSAYNGYYAKVGASGSGSWTLTNLALPSSFVADLAAVVSAQAATAAEVTAARQGSASLAERLTAILNWSNDQDAGQNTFFNNRIDGEVTARTSADNALGVRIDNEATARASAINGEATARTSADNALGVRIDGETSARTNALTAEVSARNAAIAQAIANLLDSAPGALDTLNELAAAIGDDPNFAATVTNALASRLRVDAAQILSSAQKLTAKTNLDLQNVNNTSDANKPVSIAQQAAFDAEATARTSADNALGVRITPFETAFDTDEIETGVNKPLTIANADIENRHTVLVRDLVGRPLFQFDKRTGLIDVALSQLAIDFLARFLRVGGEVSETESPLRGIRTESGVYLLAFNRRTGEARIALDDVTIANIASRMQISSFGPADLDSVPAIAFDRVEAPTQYGTTALRVLGSPTSADGLAAYLVRTDLPASATAIKERGGPVEMVPWAGESRSVGATSEPVFHTTAALPYDFFMLNDGAGLKGLVRGTDVAAFDPASATDLVPAVENYGTPTNGYGETSFTGYALMQEDMRTTRQQRTIVGRSHGASGYTLSQISPGQRPYVNGLAEIGRATQLAASYGRKLRVRRVHLTIGANDRSKALSEVANLQAALVALKNAYAVDIPALTGQSEAVELWCNQNGAATDNGPSGAGAGPMPLAMLAAHEAGDLRLVMACYHLDYVSGPTQVHENTPSQMLMGEYHALAEHIEDEGGGWDCCRTLNISRAGATIDITVNLPEGGSLIDYTDFTGPAENKGFRYNDDGGAIVINSVTITGANTIRVILSADPSANTGRYLSYALSGGPGNVLGQAGTWGTIFSTGSRASISVPGRPLHHPLLIFRKPV
jgi:hypothetical protein